VKTGRGRSLFPADEKKGDPLPTETKGARTPLLMLEESPTGGLFGGGGGS